MFGGKKKQVLSMDLLNSVIFCAVGLCHSKTYIVIDQITQSV